MQQIKTTTRDWLERLYGRSPGHFTVVVIRGGKVRARWYETSDLDRAARAIHGFANKGSDVYVSVATHREPAEAPSRGTEKTVISIPGLWADLDIGEDGHKPASLPNPKDEDEALSLLDGLPEPTSVIHSGGGLQAWWLFDEPWVFDDPQEASRVSEDWQRSLVQRGETRGLHVDNVADLARILRVPGTFNCKLAERRPVVMGSESGLTYRTEDLGSLGIPAVVEPGEEDTFPLSWQEILGPHGYTFGGIDAGSGGTLVVRPGKTLKEGHSGVIDPYGIPVYVNYSSSDPKLPSGPGQRLTKLRVYALLNHDGNLRAARRELDRTTKDSDAKLLRMAERFTPLNWHDVLNGELPEPEWLVEPLLERGQSIAVYSTAKVGKSLLLLDVCASLASGRPVLGNPAREAIDITYIDQENMLRDLRERLTKMGYLAEDVARLHYYSFPDLDWLDTEQGGRELLGIVLHDGSQVVVIDTLSRVTLGGENENDTYHSFYKFTGKRLKARGIATVRLDHAGKDESKGMRGASAKTTDVDSVWQLTDIGDDTLALNRTHQRQAHGDSRLVIQREDDPLRHTVELLGELGTMPRSRTAEIIRWMDLHEIPASTGYNQAYEIAKEYDDHPVWTRAEIQQAVKRRKGGHLDH